MPVDIRDLVVTARLRKRPTPTLDKTTLDRLRQEIVAACMEEMTKTMRRLTER